MVLGAQLSLQGLRDSTNARSAHFLRSNPPRLVQEGIRLHDRGLRAALAVSLGQAKMPKGPLCDMPDDEISKSFRWAYPRMGLHKYSTGLEIHRWELHSVASYVRRTHGSWRRGAWGIAYSLSCRR